MESSNAFAYKVFDAMHLMEVCLTEKIADRCDGVEHCVDAGCDELHWRFTACCYTIQQEVDAAVYDESSDHESTTAVAKHHSMSTQRL
jgi:hypothetical protein